MFKKVIVFLAATISFFSTTALAIEEVKQWDRYEISMVHKPGGNPYLEDSLFAIFRNNDTKIKVRGFYDGEGTYKIRFMPYETGHWTYSLESNLSEIDGRQGEFLCVSPAANHHGLAKVRKTYHFEFSDKTPYYPFGTTVYSLVHQNDEGFHKALVSLEKSPFNKVRFCIFPQFQDYTEVNPPFFPFIRKASDGDTAVWDLNNFNPEFFRSIENKIEMLRSKGIEADILIFHPYDEGKWGFDKMTKKQDIQYVKYLVSRLSSFSNVWWSLANEYDFLKNKSLDDWNDFIKTIAAEDPYKHLTSIHNGKRYFENWNKDLTHASIQNGALVEDFGRAVILRDAYKKPVVYDEICYEGDIVHRWGNLKGKELTFRYWQSLISGTYASHGETITEPDSVLHLIYGRELRGKSVERIRFLKDIIKQTGSLEPVDKFWGDNHYAVSEKGDILIYFGKNLTFRWDMKVPREIKDFDLSNYEVYMVDTWRMKTMKIFRPFLITPKKYMALWLKRKTPLLQDNLVLAGSKGYAKTSVNTTIFRTNSLVTYKDSQYIAYYDENSFVTLGKRKSGEDKWQTHKTQFKGNCSDAHNVISIMVDGSGYLHVAFDHHGNQLNYTKSITPGGLELHEKMPMTGYDESNVTYPEFYKLKNGDLIFAYRSGASGRGNLVLNRYDHNQSKWYRLQDVLIDGENKRNAYWQLYLDNNDVMHLSWVWRESPGVETNHDLCYAKSEDAGLTWKKSSGEFYHLPITATNAEYACIIPQNSELINQTSMFADKKGRPYIVTYWRDQNETVPQYRLVWNDGKVWKNQKVMKRKTPFSLSGGGTKLIPISRPKIAVYEKGGKTAAYFIFRDIERGSKVSLATSNDISKGVWQVRDVTNFSVGAWEPTYDTELWKNSNKLNIFVQRSEQGDGEKSVNIPAQPVYVLEIDANKSN